MADEACADHVGDRGFAAAWSGFSGSGGVETVEDEEIALGVVEGWKGGDALEVIAGRKDVHFVVFDLVPGDVPAGMIGLDADGEVGGAEIVADGGQAGHEGEVYGSGFCGVPAVSSRDCVGGFFARFQIR